MEYHGHDMRTIMRSIKNGTMLNERHILTLMYNMLCGLKFMHQFNIMHRDLKPANILVGLDCSIKFCDFGLSRKLPRKSENINDVPSANFKKQINQVFGQQSPDSTLSSQS